MLQPDGSSVLESATGSIMHGTAYIEIILQEDSCNLFAPEYHPKLASQCWFDGLILISGCVIVQVRKLPISIELPG
jgi:hypothetical protein